MPKKPRRKRRQSSYATTNSFEALEDRRLLATFVVNNLLDAPVNNPIEVPGSLRQAVFDANANPGADTIVFEGFATSGQIPLSAGSLQLTESVEIVGPGADQLTISGGGNSNIFWFGDDIGASTFDVSGLTLADGNGVSNAGLGNSGGAVLFFDSLGAGGEDTLNISDVVFQNNTASQGGGLHAELGTVNIVDTTFSGNEATDGNSGGGGLNFQQSDVTLTRVTVDNNSAVNFGGGIRNVVPVATEGLGDSNLTIIDSTISGNDGFRGGGIFSASESGQADATLNITGTSITGNDSNFAGGGIRLGGSEVTVSSSLIANNTAAQAAGVFLANSDGRFENTTISGNISSGSGSAIELRVDRNDDPSGQGVGLLDIVNSTIAFNIANGGDQRAFVVDAAANSTGIATFQNSIIANNIGGPTFLETGNGFASIESAGHNVSDVGLSIFTEAGDQPNTDPLLFPLADNGGASLTHALRLESPAINAGSNALAVDADGNTFATDQRGAGFDRILDGAPATVDAGAFEAKLFEGDLVVSTTTDIVDNDFSAGELSLREAVLISNARIGADTITFDSALNGQTITLTPSQKLQVTESVDIVGLGASDLTVSGGGNGNSLLFHFGDMDGASTFSISGLTIADTETHGDGAAILFSDSLGSGGEDTLNISDVVVRDNIARNGAGLYAVLGTLNITDSSFTGNEATNNGGGIFLQQTDATLTRVNVTNNEAFLGGGIHNVAAVETSNLGDANLAIIDSTISGNVAGQGGGIFNQTQTPLAEANLIVSETTIFGNQTTGNGGGINSNAGVVTVSSSLIAENIGGSAGAGILATNAQLRVENSTLSGNRSDANSGGAIRLLGDRANDPNGTGESVTEIVNSTVAFNNSATFGAITIQARVDSSAVVTSQNSIFANNSGSPNFGVANSDGQTTFASAGHNISDDATGVLVATGDQPNTDPLLFPLADNGGQSLTHALQIGSPAIDAGSNALAVDADGNPLVNDQRGEGFTRILDGDPATVDVGAFENKTFDGDLVVSTNSDVVDSLQGEGELSLREAILIANDRAGSDTITFASGLSGQTITLGGSELQVTESLDIVGLGANEFTISGDDSSNIFTFGDAAGASTFSVSGVTLTNGIGSTAAGSGTSGGAILFFDNFGSGGEDTLNISDVVIQNSTATRGGGLHSVLGTLNVSDTSFIGNQSTGGDGVGGGGGLNLEQTQTTLTRVVVDGNVATNNGNGGGIRNIVLSENGAFGDSNLTIVDSTISNNNAQRAGGIFNQTQSDSAEATLTISGTSISSNSSIFAGGGIRNQAGIASISNSLIADNVAPFAGALFQTNAETRIENSTISGNSATSGSGAIEIRANRDNDPDGLGQDTLEFVNATIAFNTSNAVAHAINVDAETSDSIASVTFENSIFSNNVGAGNFNTTGSGTAAVISAGFNISDDATGNLTATGDQPNTDPLLEPLADNEGLTQTHALQDGSPAIDAGNSIFATDQRGAIRPFDDPNVTNASGSNGSDIGAFELTPPIEDPSLTVTTDLDVVDEFDQLTSLREAIAFADSTLGEDTITFDPSLSGATIQLQSNTGNALRISDSLVIDASSLTDPLTVVGNGTSRVVNFFDADGDLTVDGLTITGGVANGNDGGGGGIRFNSSGELTVRNSTISNNATTSTASSGGGIFVGISGSLVVANSVISDNTARQDGGAIRSDGSVTVINSTISGNAAENVGGAIDTDSSSGTLAISGSTISSNSAASAGGGIQSEGTVNVTNSTISGNTTGGAGGGIDTASASVNVTNSTIGGNTAGGDGGGIETGSGSVTVTDSTISGNSAGRDGGGIDTDDVVTVTNSTISGNTAANRGGGIKASDDPVTITNSTIVNNESQQGGGVFIDASTGTLMIENSIVAENVVNSVPNDVDRVSGSQLVINHSLIGNADGLGTINGNVGNLFGTEASPLDPLLGELADNGGPTLTHGLLPGSPAIDAGNNALAVDENGDPLVFDQRVEGFDRIFGSAVDMGAFESTAADAVAPTVESIVINEGDEQRSMVNSITVSFSEVVNVSASDFILQNTDTVMNITPDVSTAIVGGKTVATLTFSGTGIIGGSLADGNYSLTVLDTITDTAGNVLDGDGDGSAGGNATDDFFRLYGDVNGDRTVNIVDFFQFRNAFGNSNLDERFDFNGDGAINILDFFQFRSRFGTSV